MADSERWTPLADHGRRFAQVSDAESWISETLNQDKLNLRLNTNDDAPVRDAEAAIGCALPRSPNTFATSGDIAVLWLGPDEWLIVAPLGTLGACEAGLRAALDGHHHAITDLSAGRAAIDLGGKLAREVLAKGTSLELDGMGTGTCAQTLMGRAQIILQVLDTGRPVYRIHVRNSFASYLAEWMSDALRESRLSATLEAARRKA